ncbi:MAG: HDOD domain-containing protein [Bacillota bacterium]
MIGMVGLIGLVSLILIGLAVLTLRRDLHPNCPEITSTVPSPSCQGAWADGKHPETDLTTPIAPPASTAESLLPIGVRLRTVGNGESLINECAFDHVMEGLKRIPPLPQAVLLILHELEDLGSSAKSIADIVSMEPVLAATVLRVCNSAAMGLRREIVRLDQAVAYLGFSLVKSIVLQTKLSEIFVSRGSTGKGYNNQRLWLHSLAVAQLSEHLAKRVGQTDPWLASTIGLLHDLGKLAINSQFPGLVAKIWEKSPIADESFLARERRLFGADHAAIGQILANNWKLPEDLAHAIRLHHLPADPALDDLDAELLRAIQVVHVANQLAKYSYVYCEDMEIDIIPAEVLTSLGLPTQIEHLLDDSIRKVINQALAVAGEQLDDTSARMRLVCSGEEH